MVSALVLGEGFVLFLVAIGYVPAVRAYLVERDAAWLVAGYTALLIGRVAALVEHVAFSATAALVEHGVGVALAGVLFGLHLYGERHEDESRYRADSADLSQPTGDD